jgi:hypothetical protein
MIIHRLTEPPDSCLSAELMRFETCFTYPLGVDDTFSISHGADYTRFFRSLGNACVYAAEVAGEIVGVMTVVRRRVKLGSNDVESAYLCDTKVAPAMRGGLVLARLAHNVKRDLALIGVVSAYCVVMFGSTTPESYTGRAGIPTFSYLSRLHIVRWSTQQRVESTEFFRQNIEEPIVQVTGGCDSLKSKMLVEQIKVDGATGILLDTRAGKCLWRSDGKEMISAHLSVFAVNSTQALTLLINHALSRAEALGFPELFCAMPPGYAYRGNQALLAAAAVYGTALPIGSWLIPTSEI